MGFEGGGQVEYFSLQRRSHYNEKYILFYLTGEKAKREEGEIKEKKCKRGSPAQPERICKNLRL